MTAVYIARASAVAARVLDGEMMIMSAKDSTLFTLNPVGTMIWQSADGKTPLHEIVANKICAEFEIEPVEALKDAESFVSDLASHGIMRISDEPISPKPEGRGAGQ
jgi:hypothetical protein